MEVLDLEKTVDNWSYLSNKVVVPHTAEEYEKLVAVLDELIDKVGENELHPLASLMEVIGVLIANYENQYIPELTED